ncbi:MAG: hypothetical protein N2749_06140 [Clostridia bacterium]|nr:hypothetical protein [Clostridia bacterium]
MSNIFNSKLMELLSGVDKSKIEQVSKMVNNMSKEDLNNLMGLLSNGSNGNRSATSNPANNTNNPKGDSPIN